MKKPNLYRYDFQENLHNVYIGNFSTQNALSYLDPNFTLSNLELGATNYKKLGFANEKDLPKFETILELESFLKNEELDLINFQVKVNHEINLNSHDDFECNLAFPQKKELVSFLNKIIMDHKEFDIPSALFKNIGIYINFNDDGSINKYASFDAYLKST